MKIAIVDDNLSFAEEFSNILISKWKFSPTRPDVFLDAENYINSCTNYDVVFLDIEMPDVSGIKLAQNTISENTNIIFVSHRDDLVFEAYNTTNAIGFIRKSHLEEDLNVIINRIERNRQTLMYLTIKNGNSFTKIRYSDVVFVEKIAKEIVLHTETNSYTTRKSMSEAEHELRPYGFIRTHVGFLVNIAYVELITPINAILKGGKSVPISRQKLKFVKDMFLERNVMLNE